MSASAPAVNVVTLVGNLTADPILKQLDDDRKVCNLRLAVNDQKDQPPMFIDVATFGAQADACAKYLTKGRAVAVTGRLVYREWERQRHPPLTPPRRRPRPVRRPPRQRRPARHTTTRRTATSEPQPAPAVNGRRRSPTPPTSKRRRHGHPRAHLHRPRRHSHP